MAGSHDIISRNLMPHRHSALLGAIILAFAIRPLIGDTGAGPVLFSFAIVAILLIGLYATTIDELQGERARLLAQRRRRSRLAMVMAAVAIAERTAMAVAPSFRLAVIGSACWLIFFAFITWGELRAVLRQREVTGETISMSISVYLLMGFTWGILYGLIYQLHPQAFSFPAGTEHAAPGISDHQTSVLPVFVYFSLTTLTTIGYGDIAPLTLKARYAAVAEGVTGQFYLAILVARLVAMQMNRDQSQRGGRKSSDRSE
jgi:hypothetical protein